MALVYQHIRQDNKKIIYIGISNRDDFKRPFNFHHRNKEWHKIFDIFPIKVEIIKDNISIEAACELEKELIKKYGKAKDNTGSLVNFGDGGEAFKPKAFLNKQKGIINSCRSVLFTHKDIKLEWCGVLNVRLVNEFKFLHKQLNNGVLSWRINRTTWLSVNQLKRILNVRT